MFDYSFKPVYTTLNSSLEPSTESRVIHNQRTLLKHTVKFMFKTLDLISAALS